MSFFILLTLFAFFRPNETDLDELPLPGWGKTGATAVKSNANLFALVKGISTFSKEEVRGQSTLLCVCLSIQLLQSSLSTVNRSRSRHAGTSGDYCLTVRIRWNNRFGQMGRRLIWTRGRRAPSRSRSILALQLLSFNNKSVFTILCKASVQLRLRTQLSCHNNRCDFTKLKLQINFTVKRVAISDVGNV